MSKKLENDQRPLWEDFFKINAPWIALPTHAGKWLVKDPATEQILNAYVRDDKGHLTARILTVNEDYVNPSTLLRYGWGLWKPLEL